MIALNLDELVHNPLLGWTKANIIVTFEIMIAFCILRNVIGILILVRPNVDQNLTSVKI